MKNKSGYMVNNYYSVLLSWHNDIIIRLDESGIGDFIRERDKYIIDNINEKSDIIINAAILQGFGESVCYGMKLNFIKEDRYNKISRDTEYLVKEHSKDVWMISDSASNNACDSILYIINEDVYNITKEIKLYVYVKNVDIKEIYNVSDNPHMPEYDKDTVRIYLATLGMDKDTAEFIISNPPKEKLKILKC